ncbi:hypothetical protein, partial [Enterococcus faecalis]|uniref:hypothetical protein n=1 Tax=Enterococcus faecalis TaxID=1351 RepID=UPI00403F9327
HQTQGTRDFSAFLTIPTAIEFMQQHNWETISAACRTLVLQNAPTLCNILNAEPLCNFNNDFLVQLYSAGIKTKEPEKLKVLLYDKYKIE